jgi:hypothetical protein
MGMNYKLLAASLLLSLALVLVSCDPDEGPRPPDCTFRANAGFKVYEVFGVTEPFFYVSTRGIEVSNVGVFRADSVQTSYRWRIGSDTRVFTSREVRLGFTQLLPSTSVGLRTRLTNECSVQSSDSATQFFVVEQTPRDSLYGFFQGSTSDAPTDTFTIRIGFFVALGQSNPRLHVMNFPKGFEEEILTDESYGYYRFYCFLQSNIPSGTSATRKVHKGMFDVSQNNGKITLTLLECTSRFPTPVCATTRPLTFTGRRL